MKKLLVLVMMSVACISWGQQCVNSEKIAQTYNKNIYQAEELYSNKPICITGKVLRVGNESGVPFIELQGQILFSVKVYMLSTDKLSKIDISQSVTLDTTCIKVIDEPLNHFVLCKNGKIK